VPVVGRRGELGEKWIRKLANGTRNGLPIDHLPGIRFCPKNTRVRGFYKRFLQLCFFRIDTRANARIDIKSDGVINKKCCGISHRDTTLKNGVKDFGTVTHGLFFGNLGLDESGNPFYPVKIRIK
jgi:hypothetical protein